MIVVWTGRSLPAYSSRRSSERWRFAIGHYIGAGPVNRDHGDLRTSWRRVAGWCRRLSRDFGKAHAFTDQAQMDWFTWILARDGLILRQAVFEDGEYLTNRGRPSGIEARQIARFMPNALSERWRPDCGDVPAIAGENSINLWRFGAKARTVGQGCVAVTAWGRQHGVVFTRLGV
jgi:hypothetical protein